MVNQETGAARVRAGQGRSRSSSRTTATPPWRAAPRTRCAVTSGATTTCSRCWPTTRTPSRTGSSTVAEPIIAQVRAGDPAAFEAAGSEDAKAAFDRIRAASSSLTDAHRRPSDWSPRPPASGPSTTCSSPSASAPLLLLVAAALLWRGLRRSVLAPDRRPRRPDPAGGRGLARPADRPERSDRDRRPRPGRRHHAGPAGRPDRGHRARPAPAPAARRRAGPLQRRPRAVRLRRLARPVRAAAQGDQLLPAARAAVRRPARRQGPAVHRLHGRRREADADPDQRPAGVLAGRSQHRGLRPGRPRQGPGPRPHATST